jgi:hypothetical protein
VATRALFKKTMIFSGKKKQSHRSLGLTPLPDEFTPYNFDQPLARARSSVVQALQYGGLASRTKRRVALSAWLRVGHFAS